MATVRVRDRMREDQARILDCPSCRAEANAPCVVMSGKNAGKSRRISHAARVEAVAVFISDAYCQNESYSGYPCGRQGCPHCGGGNYEG